MSSILHHTTTTAPKNRRRRRFRFRVHTHHHHHHVHAAVPRGKPARAGERRVSAGPFRGVHRDEREVSGVFASASVFLTLVKGSFKRGLFLSHSFFLSLILSLSLFLASRRRQKEKSDSNKCKRESKLYLECRMANELMAEQPFATLGFREDETTPDGSSSTKAKPKTEELEEENEKTGFVAGARRARQQQREMEERREGRGR